MDEAKYSCDEGFKHSESSSKKIGCLSDANFEQKQKITCERISCTDPNLPLNGFFFQKIFKKMFKVLTF